MYNVGNVVKNVQVDRGMYPVSGFIPSMFGEER